MFRIGLFRGGAELKNRQRGSALNLRSIDYLLEHYSPTFMMIFSSFCKTPHDNISNILKAKTILMV